MSIPDPLARKLALLVPRLASDADGEVLATVAAIRRVLASGGLDLHDLAAVLTCDLAPETDPTPAEIARDCLRSRLDWREHERDFLTNISRRGRGWATLSERQKLWLFNLWNRAAREAA